MAKISINLVKGKIDTPADHEVILGIDLGTTNSLVAYIDECNRQPVCLAKNSKHTLIPSIIHFEENGNILVGDEAKAKIVEADRKSVV